ncbi:hypothetical protein ACK83U_14985 [Rhizobium sp. WW22]|uniref:hypothetical protein n=1 Tax=Rhizobium sp. WW22 TaxID=3389070 RepID=UPI00399A0ECE
MHQMLGFLLRSEANRTDNRLIHRSTSEQILAADADKFGSKPQGMYLLQKAIRTQYIYLEAITQTLAEGIAQFIMHPRLSAGGHNCDFPFVSVCSVEAKIAVLVGGRGYPAPASSASSVRVKSVLMILHPSFYRKLIS